MRILLKTALRIVVCAALLFVVWAGGLAWFAAQVPLTPAADSVTTDAIVVLTGGKGRIDYGLKLLSEGRASRLFISGVEDGVTPDALVARHKPSLGDVAVHDDKSAVIKLGYSARNTIGNAMETAQWMRRERLSSLRLVTASYHMPRALYEFRHAMPDVTIVPDAVVPDDFDAARWWTNDASSRLLLSEYHKFIAAWLRHWLLRVAGDAE